MTQQIILEMVDRRSISATLADPFTPSNNQIIVKLSDSDKKASFQLSEICCIRMKDCPDWAPSKHDDSKHEEIQTTSGISFYASVPEKQQFQTGFFAFSIEENSEFHFLFFSFIGTRSRKLFTQLGEILEKSGTVSSDNIKKALTEQKRQKDMRLGEIISEKQGVPIKTINDTIQRMLNNKKVPPRARIGDILVAAGLVNKDQIDQTLAIQKNNKSKPLGELLIEQKLVTEEQILVALASKFRLPYLSLKDVTPSPTAINLISPEIVRQLQILPIEIKGNSLIVAISDPADHAAITDALRFHAQRRIDLVVALKRDISNKISELYHEEVEEDHVDNIIDEISEDDVSLEEDSDDYSVTEADSKLIRLLNKILIDGFTQSASDIHIEPGSDRDPIKIRYRVDGICHIAHTIPRIYSRAIISRLKIMATLDISERRRPQSGKIVIRYSKKKIEYRLEVTPTVGGNEDAVLRILSGSTPLDLDSMGFSPYNHAAFADIISKPYGLILCVGPTGSGKTTTLHSALSHINKPDRKIWTAEDPVEITQKGLRQVQVNSKIGFTFEEALRSFLRADPDIIMIGEMRDPITAKIAVEASLTGHLVLSTLHTNSAAETVTRLMEMGLEPYHFADVFLGIIAQRLGLRLCSCKEPYHPDQEEYDKLVYYYSQEFFEKDKLPAYDDKLTLMRENGCPKCGESGYKGRVGIHELLAGSPEVKNAIRESVPVNEIQEIAMKDGMRTLTMDGIYKVFQGDTDFMQVNRVVVSG